MYITRDAKAVMEWEASQTDSIDGKLCICMQIIQHCYKSNSKNFHPNYASKFKVTYPTDFSCLLTKAVFNLQPRSSRKVKEVWLSNVWHTSKSTVFDFYC